MVKTTERTVYCVVVVEKVMMCLFVFVGLQAVLCWISGVERSPDLQESLFCCPVPVLENRRSTLTASHGASQRRGLKMRLKGLLIQNPTEAESGCSTKTIPEISLSSSQI